MGMSLRIEKDGHEINTVDEWLRFAPPQKGLSQWKNGRSAKELAKAFVGNGAPLVPREVHTLISSNKNLGTIELTVAHPEHKIRLDRYPGNTRNADLAAIGHGQIGKTVVTIEAKVDEPFDKTIGQKRAVVSPTSNVPKRINALTELLFGHASSQINNLRYQLLCAAAGSLFFAKDQSASAAVFIVLELHGPSCNSNMANLRQNQTDFELFLRALSQNILKPIANNLSGPFFVRGRDMFLSELPLFVGKTSIEV